MLTHLDASLGRWATEVDLGGAWSDPTHLIIRDVVDAANSMRQRCGFRVSHVLISSDLASTLMASSDVASRLRHSLSKYLTFDMVLADLFDVKSVRFDLSVGAWVDWSTYKENASIFAKQRHAESNSRLDLWMRNCVLMWSRECLAADGVFDEDNRNAGALLYNCAKWMPCSATS